VQPIARSGTLCGMSTKTTIPCLLLIALGCAPLPERGSEGQPSSGSEAGATAAAEPEMICKKERPTGSNITRRVCYPKATTAASQSELDRIQRGASRSNHTGGQ
jgi:hypothetical protein